MSDDATRQNFRIRRGDDWGQGVTLICRDGSGNTLDITGAEIRMTIRDKAVRDPEATDETHPPVLRLTSPAVVGGPGGITVTDGPNGEANPLMTPAQTKILVKKRYFYDVQVKPVTSPLAGIVKTIGVGTIETLDEYSLDV